MLFCLALVHFRKHYLPPLDPANPSLGLLHLARMVMWVGQSGPGSLRAPSEEARPGL